MYEQGLELFREMGDVRGIAREANGLAVAHRRQGKLADVAGQSGDSARAAELIEEALGIFRELEYMPGVAWSFSHMGDQARRENDFETAKVRYEEALELFRSLGHRMGVGRCLQDLAELACVQEDFSTAKPMFECALDHFVAVKHDRGLCMLLDRMSSAQVRLFRPAPALTLAGAASTLRESAGAKERPWASSEQALREKTLEAARSQLDDEAAKDSWEQGRVMERSEALEYARRLDWTVSRRSSTGPASSAPLRSAKPASQ